MGAGWCTPGSPAASVAVSAPDFAGADATCGTSGTFSGSQESGRIALFGPSGSAMTGFTYVSQNVAQGGGCGTTVDVEFSLPADLGSNNIVIAWGGHIASAQDWGTGNSASAVSGSPYHMSLDAVDGSVTGSMDRSLKTDAISSVPLTPGPGSPTVTPTITTVVKDGATGQPWSGDETTGATAYDTSAIAGTDGPVATGTVTYTYFDNGDCQGTGPTQTVTLVDGVPPDASTTSPLAAGDYSYDAVYSGDTDYNPSAVSACEPFTVDPAPTNVSNVVFSKQTGAAWSGTEVAGGKANDTATLGGAVPGFVPTGTATYSYFANGNCGGAPVWTDTVSLTGAGTIPDSNPTDALAAGTYSFDVAYNGDSNYGASDASACAAFVVTPITNVGPTFDPSGSTGGTNGGTGGTSGSSDPGATDPTPPATHAAGTSAAVTAAPVVTTPAGPVTKPGLAWTGANIGLTASLAVVLLALGSLLVAVSRRRRHETA
jgi:hypothetical protein